MSLGAVVVRTFGDADAGQRVTRTLELPMPPARGQKFTFPEAAEAVPVDRVYQRPAEPGGWRPGFTPPAVTVQMAPEPADGLQAALSAGWKALAG